MVSGAGASAAVLRRTVVALLRGGQAHVTTAQALDDLPHDLRGARAEELPYSVWEQLEHMRIAQEDILRFTSDAGWSSPSWPEEYWPEHRREVDDATWVRSRNAFERDLDELIALVEDSDIALTDEIPHGEGRTYLRQALLTADHNAYHLGQIVLLRRALGAWPG